MTTSIQTPAIPARMVEVTKEVFFARLYADPRDIMPKLNRPDSTDWETKGRERWGWTMPGWKNHGANPVYAVTTNA